MEMIDDFLMLLMDSGTGSGHVRSFLLVRMFVEHVLQRLQVRTQQKPPQIPAQRRVSGKIPAVNPSSANLLIPR